MHFYLWVFLFRSKPFSSYTISQRLTRCFFNWSEITRIGAKRTWSPLANLMNQTFRDHREELRTFSQRKLPLIKISMKWLNLFILIKKKKLMDLLCKVVWQYSKLNNSFLLTKTDPPIAKKRTVYNKYRNNTLKPNGEGKGVDSSIKASLFSKCDLCLKIGK